MSDRRVRRTSTWIGGLLIVVMLFTAILPPSRPVTAHGDEDGEEPSAQALIAGDLMSGQIGYGESLVYRAYAQFGDSRLPQQFTGPGDSGVHDDLNLFLETRRFWDDLSPAVQAQLRPFLLRPTDPGSIYERPGMTYHLAPIPEAARSSGGCQDGWLTSGSELHPEAFKVWIQCTGEYERDLARAVELIDSFWQDEVDLMSTGPMSDEKGGDSRLDFYIVGSAEESLPSDTHRSNLLTDDALAFAMPEEPFTDQRSSGYVVARRERLSAPGFPLDLGHEFYHILQFAHNVNVGYGFLSRPYGEFDILQLRSYWFIEAMAVWLESYEFRGVVSDNVMNREVHGRFTNIFQVADLSLAESPDRASPQFGHIYAAYIWFYFMEQEIGPEAVASIWTDMEAVEQDDFAGAMQVINNKLPFAEHFRDFAVRNLNLDLAGDPINPNYADLDPTFPIGIRPPLKVGERGSGKLAIQDDETPARNFDELLQSLAAHYYLFAPDPDATQFTFDFSQLGHRDALDVDVIVRLQDGTWERRQLSTDGPVTFCRNNPDDDISQVYVILSNHDMNIGTTVSGQFSVDVRDTPC